MRNVGALVMVKIDINKLTASQPKVKARAITELPKPKKDNWGNADFSDNVTDKYRPVKWKQPQPNAWWA